MKDFGLTYQEAMHGIQTSIALREVKGDRLLTVKHMRVGIDSAHVTNLALAELLIAKGVFTREEYVESVRLAANDELARAEVEFGITFR